MMNLTDSQLEALEIFLEGPEACNFEKHPLREGEYVWTCDHTLTFTRRWLHSAGFKDIDGICEWLQDHGGNCDCEVLLNVRSDLEWTQKELAL